ncbi:MAG: hypothetical protein A2087_06065 [Spirochaetes bacterium GWD1_61_31]|nr:MAG: hypothetical protein A2Y37_13170 [Spirochaetes bacterium GWB1_60_80]OHD35476.1 MAG: hypothetical protein A2004_08485 [Spirochaetes bacterium GWC1_61_12]OHD42504.1 MAG: hypothetical protein A2Y35_07965 [Spirochaetes bacterium GWE1_60_18]OHD43173.1 MAG: hypothetical protein A2087_06065 [Spirochaetes bacterium GWD1_61_31]OHD58232.1 MAG: hypothetical protein A2Y32_04885 [Spirochaetes bacterium GWF1_60_12]HAP42489.1 hypothetical protein [Spirochaetaceae bacterium]
MELADAGPGAFKHGPAYRRVMLGCATRAAALFQGKPVAAFDGITPWLAARRSGFQRRSGFPLGWVLGSAGGSPFGRATRAAVGGLVWRSCAQARQCWALCAARGIPAYPHSWWLPASALVCLLAAGCAGR